tara:strand:- start:122 stop:463 length:342 start_codon:yes stop_codon:yes gene_type:complete
MAGKKKTKYMAKGGKTSKYKAKGGAVKKKTTKTMAKGGAAKKTSKYMAKGGKTTKYMSKGGKAKSSKKSPTPANPKLYASVKAAAKKKFKVYPSAYANAWLVREYKKRGGKYK